MMRILDFCVDRIPLNEIMSIANNNVAVILDPSFGEKLDELARMQPVWLFDSRANRKAAELLWTGKTLPPDWVTIFDCAATTSRTGVLLDVLDSLNEHHPSWRRLHVIGVELNSAIDAALALCGNGIIEQSDAGFVYDRSDD
jgi:hypothetical protein